MIEIESTYYLVQSDFKIGDIFEKVKKRERERLETSYSYYLFFSELSLDPRG